MLLEHPFGGAFGAHNRVVPQVLGQPLGHLPQVANPRPKGSAGAPKAALPWVRATRGLATAALAAGLKANLKSTAQILNPF